MIWDVFKRRRSELPQHASRASLVSQHNHAKRVAQVLDEVRQHIDAAAEEGAYSVAYERSHPPLITSALMDRLRKQGYAVQKDDLGGLYIAWFPPDAGKVASDKGCP